MPLFSQPPHAEYISLSPRCIQKYFHSTIISAALNIHTKWERTRQSLYTHRWRGEKGRRAMSADGLNVRGFYLEEMKHLRSAAAGWLEFELLDYWGARCRERERESERVVLGIGEGETLRDVLKRLRRLTRVCQLIRVPYSSWEGFEPDRWNVGKADLWFDFSLIWDMSRSLELQKIEIWWL